MTKVSYAVQIAAAPEAVWNVLTDSSFIPKLYPDVVSVEVDPPGKTRVGTKFHIIGKAGRRRIEIFAEITEMVPMRMTKSKNTPGGLFKTFNQEVMMEAKGAGTALKTVFEYELSMGYIGKIFNVVILERLVMDNLRAYTTNLKELSEVIPLLDEGSQ